MKADSVEKFQRNPNVTVEPALKVKADEFKDVYNVLRIASTAYLTELTSAEFTATWQKSSPTMRSLVKPSVTLRTWKKPYAAHAKALPKT